MKALLKFILCLEVVFTFLPTSTAAPEDLEKIETSARGFRAKGDLFAAVEQYRKAQLAAIEQNLGTEKVAATTLEFAAALENLATERGGGSTDLLKQAGNAYQEVIQKGNLSQQNLARNNFGNLLLKEGASPEALSLFAAIQWDQVPASQRFVYHYNYGRSLESNEHTVEAFDQYVLCLTDRPEFYQARDSAMRIILQDEARGILEALELSNLLLSKGERDAAGDVALRSLDRWGGKPDAQRLLGALLQYITDFADTSAFRATERHRILGLAEKFPNLRQAISNIDVAYVSDFGPGWREGVAASIFPAWSGEKWKVDAFTSFLLMVGRSRAAQKLYQEALSRYLAAWDMDRENSEAVLSAAALLRDHSDTLDPHGETFNRIVVRLFMQKEEAYLGENLKNILRLHTVLGTIFERESRWGSPAQKDSAIFQWKHAVEIDRKLHQRDPGHPLSPGLYLHLGNCYLNTGQTSLAAEAYLTSAELFHEQSKFEAKDAFQKARSVSEALDERSRNRLTTLERSIKTVPNPE